MKSFVLRHKILRAAAAAALILVGLAFAACGAGGGHSAAYKAGYDWAIQDIDSGAVPSPATRADADEVCGQAAIKGINGSNDSKEWTKGCTDAVLTHTATAKTSGGTP